MDLALDDDQQMLVESFGALLDKQSTTEAVRAAEPLGFDSKLWRAMHDVGVVQMALPDAAGGWGASMLDLCLVAEQLGRRCAPVPVIEGQVTARLLARLGRAEADDLSSGDLLGTTAVHPPVGGVARLTPAGAVAQLVLARTGDAVVAIRVDPRPPLVLNHADLPLADVSIGGAETIATGDDTVASFEQATDEWLLLTASALVGIAGAALAVAVEYAKERKAFGVPIGTFQAIAHRLADVTTAIEGARLLVHEAAWSMDSSLAEGGERACGAFAFAADTARNATYWAVHTLGGYGVMVEYDTQLYFRRARGWAGVFGDADAGYRRMATHRYRRQGT